MEHTGHEKLKHPAQPLYESAESGTVRFKPNKIVSFLLDNGPNDMNSIARGDFSREDHVQFAQLIGYSLGGFGTLSYVTDADYAAAEANEVGENTSEVAQLQARVAYLEEALEGAREAARTLVMSMFPRTADASEFVD